MMSYTRENAGGTFSSNTATAGAGMYNDSSPAAITNCTFQDNIADAGGGMYDTGSTYSTPTVAGCSFIGNMVYNTGGGMHNAAPVSVTNSTFQGNSAVSGGAVYDEYKISSKLTNCTFIGNTGGNGGAIYNDDNATTVTYSVFMNNVATQNLAQGFGGGMYNSFDSAGTIVNCTFTGNSAVSGGGIYNDTAPETLMNLVVWGNSAGSSPNVKSTFASLADLPLVSYSDVGGGCTYANLCTSNSTVGNIDADPRFVDAASGKLQLQALSPCIDTGHSNSYTNHSDIVGQAWLDIQGVGNDGSNYVDMGAYEYHP